MAVANEHGPTGPFCVMSFALTSTIKQYPTLPYEEISRAILGARYDLSLVFIGNTRAQNLNRIHRQKEYVPNVLSFPLSDTMGEIFINPHIAKKEAKDYNLTPDGYIGFLFIHGCLHLKGYDHGEEMERLETRFMKRFSLS
jgi:rRNA maturation RNase YbeY